MFKPTIDPEKVRWRGIADGATLRSPGEVRLGVFLHTITNGMVCFNFAGVTQMVVPNDGTLLERDGIDPTFGLPFEAAYALYTALAQYFEAAPESVTLRKDYEAERARVDKFIDRFLAMPS